MLNTLVLEKQNLEIESAALTDRGCEREINEDAVFQRTRRSPGGQNTGLYIVCDGLGGHRAGEVASQIAASTTAAELNNVWSLLDRWPEEGRSQWTHSYLRERIKLAVDGANLKIRQYARTYPRAADLGTTLALLLIYGDAICVANVGDSRVYGWREGRLTQISRDHSMAAELVQKEVISPEDLLTHPVRNVLTRALGMGPNVEVDFFPWNLRPGDRFLLCSDGLWQAFPDQAELGRWLGSGLGPNELCGRLVVEANRRDGSDNVSAIVVDVNGPTGLF